MIISEKKTVGIHTNIRKELQQTFSEGQPRLFNIMTGNETAVLSKTFYCFN